MYSLEGGGFHAFPLEKRPPPLACLGLKSTLSIVGALKPWNTDWDKNQERTEPTLFNITLEFNIVSR